MRTFFEIELRDKLNGIGAGKLPPLVHDALVSDISTDMQAALTKSLNRRTKPIALARLVHACLTRQAEGKCYGWGKHFMKDSVQIRIRLPKAKASPWLDIPPVLRSKVVGMVLGAVGTLNLAELASMRRELVNLVLQQA